MAADHDWIGPARDQPGHVRDHDRLTEHHPAQDVANRPVGALPHPLELEFLNPVFIGGDRRALDADAVLANRIGAIDGDPVLGLITHLDREVIILQVDVKVGQDQPLADPLPDDPGHLVAVDLNDRIFHLDLGHAGLVFPGRISLFP
jgi:hypothetical protein